MPAFFTRSSFGQPQPQVAQLPFSSFGGERPTFPTDTTGGLPFPDAGEQFQPPFPPTTTPFMRPTGLSNDELDALLGGRLGTKQEISGIDSQFSPLNRLPQNVQDLITQTLQNRTPATTSTIPTGGIPFEGSGTQDKFNPVLAGGIPLNNVNLVQSPNLQTANLPFTPNPNLLNQNKRIED